MWLESGIAEGGAEFGTWRGAIPNIWKLRKEVLSKLCSSKEKNVLVLQVDLLQPKIFHGIKTQGARQRLSNYYISQFVIFYSLDGEKWKSYKGNSTSSQMVITF